VFKKQVQELSCKQLSKQLKIKWSYNLIGDYDNNQCPICWSMTQALKVSVGRFATRAQGITTPRMNEVATCKVLMC
jgi:hypothetical protein